MSDSCQNKRYSEMNRKPLRWSSRCHSWGRCSLVQIRAGEWEFHTQYAGGIGSHKVRQTKACLVPWPCVAAIGTPSSGSLRPWDMEGCRVHQGEMSAGELKSTSLAMSSIESTYGPYSDMGTIRPTFENRQDGWVQHRQGRHLLQVSRRDLLRL